jgi:predicted Zn-dependent protease with MMP-like domain
MDDEEFEKIVAEGIDSVPGEFLEKLDNVAITIQDNPTYYQVRKIDLSHGFLLFGLYEGVALDRRGNYTGVLPDKITIFKNPMLAVARSREDLVEMVRNTVWHEIAHHFGFDEREVRAAEAKRRKNPVKF